MNSDSAPSPSLAGKRIALIGGAGFIGHNLALHLAKAGAEVTVLDSLAVNHLKSLKIQAPGGPRHAFYQAILEDRLALLEDRNIELVEVDARDYHRLSRCLFEARPQALVHLAAVAHANRSNKDPFSTFDHSLRTLENSLDFARGARDLEHYVYLSSSMVYGHFEGGVVSEDSPCNPLGIYGGLKFAGERMVEAYGQVFDLPATIVRPSALYGPRCISRRVLQIFLETAMAKEPVSIHGDGSDRLDFTYVGDLAHGIEQVLLHPEGSLGETFNLTFGASRSLADAVEILERHFPKLEVKYTPKDSLTPDRGTLDVTKARDRIDYRPSFPLEKGLEAYLAWYREVWPEGRSLPAPSPKGPKSLAGIRPDPFLAEVLGFPCQTYTPEASWIRSWRDRGPEGLEHAESLAKTPGLTTAKVAPDDLEAVHFLEAQGFRLIDTLLTFTRSLEPAPLSDLPEGYSLAEACPEDQEDLEALAGTAFSSSRLHLDSEIPRGLADASRAKWVGNFFRKARGDALFVVRFEERPVAFLLALVSDSGVLTTDLIAVSAKHRRLGLGRALMGFAEREVKAKSHRVGTQLANFASLALYQSLGFRLVESRYVFHLHGRTP